MKGEFFFLNVVKLWGKKWRKVFFFFRKTDYDLLKNENDPLIFF